MSAIRLGGESHWTIDVINGQEILKLAPPHWLNQDNDQDDDVIRTPFITVHDGQLRQGIMLHSGITGHNMIGLNALAFEQVIASFHQQHNALN